MGILEDMYKEFDLSNPKKLKEYKEGINKFVKSAIKRLEKRCNVKFKDKPAIIIEEEIAMIRKILEDKSIKETLTLKEDEIRTLREQVKEAPTGIPRLNLAVSDKIVFIHKKHATPTLIRHELTHILQYQYNKKVREAFKPTFGKFRTIKVSELKYEEHGWVLRVFFEGFARYLERRDNEMNSPEYTRMGYKSNQFNHDKTYTYINKAPPKLEEEKTHDLDYFKQKYFETFNIKYSGVILYLMLEKAYGRKETINIGLNHDDVPKEFKEDFKKVTGKGYDGMPENRKELCMMFTQAWRRAIAKRGKTVLEEEDIKSMKD